MLCVYNRIRIIYTITQEAAMIETYLLEQFVAFAKYGTLLAAAEELHITQPTLSRSMRKLEEAFGVPIFYRENSKLTLNETGKVALEYAMKVLSSNQDMIDHILSFDRSLRTVSIGSCSPFPISELMPSLQDCIPDKTLLTELVSSDEKLINDLKNHQYDLVILHTLPEDKSLFCQRYMEERIYLSISPDHPFAKKKSISFKEMLGLRILISQNIGFWMDITKKHLNESDLLVQGNTDALIDLIEASSLPSFNSDRILEQGIETYERKNIPISDDDAHATYWVACRSTDQSKYRSIFNAVRSYALRHDVNV